MSVRDRRELMVSPRVLVITRLIEEVLGGGQLDVLDRVYVPRMVPVARRWIEPFLISFPDARMQVHQLVDGGDTIVVRFRCSGTHLGPWHGYEPTGRRFENIDEVYFFTFQDDLIAKAWGIEDNLERFRQLGLSNSPLPAPH